MNQLQYPVMIHVPAGTFWMGTHKTHVDLLAQGNVQAQRWKAKGYFHREYPYHQVYLPGYAIAKYPVTVLDYLCFIEDGGYENRNYWIEAGWKWIRLEDVGVSLNRVKNRNNGGTDLPVVGVSWYEAFAYCRWLAQASGIRYRLPNEAEWEKAARGVQGQLYPWGNSFDPTCCNTRVSGLGEIKPVQAISKIDISPYGCIGMGGNVSDWVLSQYKSYPYNFNDGREVVNAKTERVIRGGSWAKPALRARTAARGMNDPWFQDNDVGFRLACDV